MGSGCGVCHARRVRGMTTEFTMRLIGVQMELLGRQEGELANMLLRSGLSLSRRVSDYLDQLSCPESCNTLPGGESSVVHYELVAEPGLVADAPRQVPTPIPDPPRDAVSGRALTLPALPSETQLTASECAPAIILAHGRAMVCCLQLIESQVELDDRDQVMVDELYFRTESLMLSATALRE